MRPRRFLISVLMAITIVLVNGMATYLGVRWDTDAPLSVAVITTAMLSFVGLMAITQPDEGEWRLTEATMRTAIAGTIVIEYLVLVATVAFFKVGPEALPAISQTMMSSFTSIVGVVIAFYFGVSAYTEVRSKREQARRTTGEG